MTSSRTKRIKHISLAKKGEEEEEQREKLDMTKVAIHLLEGKGKRISTATTSKLSHLLRA